MHALSKTQAKAGSKASHLFPISMIGDTHAHWEHTGTVGLTIGLDLFRHLKFWKETCRHGHFIMGTFQQEDILEQELFGMGIFWHHGLFGTGLLQHWEILAQ